MDLLNTILKGGSDYLNGKTQTDIAKQNTKAEQAKATAAASTTKLVIIGGAVLVVVVVLALVLRRGK